MKRTLLALLIAVASHAASPVFAADDEAPRVTNLVAGYNGHFKVGYWAPFTVAVAAGSEPVEGQLELVALDSDSTPTSVATELKLTAGEERSVTLYAKVGQFESDLTVNVRRGERVLATRRFRTTDATAMHVLRSSEELILQVGGRGTAIEIPSRRQRITQSTRVAPAQLPTAWWGYDGVDTVLLLASGEAFKDQLPAFTTRWQALERWVQMGGRVIFSVARDAQSVLASGSPLARLAPGEFNSVVPLRQGALIETYAETSSSLAIPPGPTALPAARLSEVRGKIDAFAGNRSSDLPLVVRSTYGFGEVVFVALDLDEQPLASWQGRTPLLERLLGRRRHVEVSNESSTLGEVKTLGFVDLTGQLRAALDQFVGVEVVPFWVVALALVAYIGCVGPLDYWLVRRILPRMETTWLTLLAWILLFGGTAYALASYVKGDSLRTNQIDLIDFDTTSGLVRGTSWSTLYTPRAAAFDLTVDPHRTSASNPGPALVSWLGMPGTGFGSMDTPAGSVKLFQQPYEFRDDLQRLAGVPIPTWSTKAFVARWLTEGKSPIEAQLSEQGRLVGSLVNQMDEPLLDCVLIYDRWAYPLGRFAAGRRLDVEAELDAQTVETYLRQVKLRGDVSVAAPYDRTSYDVDRIVQMLSAHELAGGEDYTRLTHEYQHWADLSPLVRNGKAVLIGRCEKGGAVWQSSGEPLNDPLGKLGTYYRFVFDVETTRAR